jgi:hypothetical protein
MLPHVTVDAILPGRGASDYERYLRASEVLFTILRHPIARTS